MKAIEKGIEQQNERSGTVELKEME